jgi:predicted RNA-binding protein with PIN domain
MSLAEEHAVFGASTNQKSAEELIKEVGIRELRVKRAMRQKPSQNRGCTAKEGGVHYISLYS